jgi:tetratricopeptide (TPR) repeat protein
MAGRTVENLIADVAFALEQGLGARDLVPMLQQLVERAPPGSDVSRFARLKLAQQLLAEAPFRAAALSRCLAQEDDTDDEAWGLYGLSLTILGHYQAAKVALMRACALAPEHPQHAHNLGHLLDAGFQRPRAALPWLKRAFAAAREVPSIASSYAHALSRSGEAAQAIELLCSHGRMDRESARRTVEEWRCPPETS